MERTSYSTVLTTPCKKGAFHGQSTNAQGRSMEQTTAAQLYFLPSVGGDGTNMGLYGGTLFDVLDVNGGTGNASVRATGFSFTCGYLTDVDHELTLNDSAIGWHGNWTSGGQNYTFKMHNTRTSADSSGSLLISCRARNDCDPQLGLLLPMGDALQHDPHPRLQRHSWPTG